MVEKKTWGYQVFDVFNVSFLSSSLWPVALTILATEPMPTTLGRRWYLWLFASEAPVAEELSEFLRCWDAFLAEEERFELVGYM